LDRRPALPVATDVDTTRFGIGPDGTKYAEYEFIYTEYDAGRLREGYACMECGEAQEIPFPERCICGYPMRDDQSRRFSQQFDGPTTIGPSRSIEELRAEDEEQKERARREREKPTSSIIVPSWAKL
jgi:hypothetical protein